MFDNYPKISVITPSFNMGKYIEDNILSVLNQTYPYVEHLIIDGGSTDNTLKILKKYRPLRWISERDEGQSDAYNKGLKLASGDLVLCLNADDYLLKEDVFEQTINELGNLDVNKYSAFMGNTYVVSEDCKVVDEMTNRNREYTFDILLNKAPVVIHPATFFRTDILKQTTGFANDIHYVMDYDIFLKVSKIKPIASIPVYVSALRRHSESKGGKGQETAWNFSYEFLKLRRKNGGSYLNKMNFQPYKHFIYKFIFGYKIVNKIKRLKFFRFFAAIIGITKLNQLFWYEKNK